MSQSYSEIISSVDTIRAKSKFGLNELNRTVKQFDINTKRGFCLASIRTYIMIVGYDNKNLFLRLIRQFMSIKYYVCLPRAIDFLLKKFEERRSSVFDN